MEKRNYLLYLLLFWATGNAGAQTAAAKLIRILVNTDRNTLNPVLEPQGYATLSVTGVYDNGTTAPLDNKEVIYTLKSELTSEKVPVAVLAGNRLLPKEGGMAVVTALVSKPGITLTGTAKVLIRPYYRDYHQTLTMKLFMGMEGTPLTGEKTPDVIYTFEEALEAIRRTDNLTGGIPKIIYLVGWQQGGHDHQYPSWETVNPRMKRKQDATAVESLRWLIREARKYHTTVSLHINMMDAYRHSPLWKTYVEKDLIARDENGALLTTGEYIKGDSMFKVSYTREWVAGLAQQRIDGLLRMIPELKEGHTIHIDIFGAKLETANAISPWHAKKENGGIDMYKEAETQGKIFHYWRERGFDVTGEGIFWAHPPGEGFYGWQPMSWWYPADAGYQMATPEKLSARGRTDRNGDGDFRFASSMHGEEIYRADKKNLSGFMEMFCRTTLPWYYLSRLDRVALINDTLFYSEGVKAAMEDGHKIIRKGNFVLREDDHLFVPALWNAQQIIAYSRIGYHQRAWVLPDDWAGVKAVDIYRITAAGNQLQLSAVKIDDGKLTLTLNKEEAVLIVPTGKK